MLAASRRQGYGHFEAVSERLLGECLVIDDRPRAAAHLDAAMTALNAAGARNEVAKTLVARAELSRLDGDRSTARDLLEDALGIFEALGTIDEPARVRARLASL